MGKYAKWVVSLVFLFIGFMVAVQFQTINSKPEIRETRDQWEVREALKEQQKKQQDLLAEISKAEQTIESYEEKSLHHQVKTLKDSIKALETKIGLQDVEGSGVIIRISPIFQQVESGQPYPSVSPQLLSRLINELNTFGATEIAVGDERLTNLSPVRNVNGETYVNNRPLSPLPLTIRVLSNNPKKLLNYIEASETRDFLNIEHLDLQADLERNMTLPKYEDPLHLEILEETGE